MIDIKDMQFLVALSQHQHFAKAADACNVSQPAFSMRVQKLEDKLGVSIVRRGNRFLGFTDQGDILVRRARGILDDTKALEQEINAASGVVSGAVTLGVVPTALAFAAQLCIRLHKAHPGIVVKIVSTSSLRIQQRLEDGTIDAGLTYDDSVSEDLMQVDRLYTEDYMLLVPIGMIDAGKTSMTWAEAAALPLSLLEPQMQNRRILDRMFAEAAVQPMVIAESNGFVSSLIIAREGGAATIVPKVLLDGLGVPDGTVAVSLEGGGPGKEICFVTHARRAILPAVGVMRTQALQ